VLDELAVVFAVPRFIELELPVESLVLDVREEMDPPAQQRLAVGIEIGAGGEPSVAIVVVVKPQADLLQVV
jgi:hypothetical protein